MRLPLDELKYTIIRKGKCKKCGKCCEGCRHLDKKTMLCEIYEKRHKYCEECGKSHMNCMGYPFKPRKGCGYRFFIVETKREIKSMELI